MSQSKTPSAACPECGAPLRAQSARGLCPRCLLRSTIGGGGEDASDDAPAAETFGDYALIRELGRGGMGIVYEARQISLGRRVALKMVLPSRLSSVADVERFRLEAAAVASLDHPNILPVYEIGEHNGQHFFAMRLVEGGTLADHIRPGRDFGPAIGLVILVARAVHHAHQHGVQHRDLKPANILLDSDARPYVSDFGLARMRDLERNLTRTSAVLGSPAYMSPEQAAGNTRLLSNASDIYSLGAILYEIITGRPPFEGENLFDVLRQLADDEPIFPRQINPAIDRDLETICLKCLRKEPEQRYASAEALAADLEHWQRGEPILARPVTAPERLWLWARRRPALALLAVTAFALLVTVAVVSTLSAIHISRARHETMQANRSLVAANTRLTSTLNELQMERVEQLFDSGQSATAMASLARVLREQPANHGAAEYLLSCLLYKNFALPVAATMFHLREIESVKFSPDGELVLTTSQDGTARLWQTATGKPVGDALDAAPNILARFNTRVLFGIFSPDGKLAATTTADGATHLWEVPSGAHLAGPIFAAGPTSSNIRWARADETPIAFSPDGKTLAVGGRLFRQPILWDIPSGQRRLRLPTQQSGVLSIAFNKDGFFATSSGNGSVRLFNRAGEMIAPRMLHDDPVYAVNFSPDGTRLISASHDKTARIWEVPSGKLLRTLAHKEAVGVGRFSPDGTKVLTASADRTAAIWDALSGQQILVFRHQDDVLSARFNARGTRLLTTSSDNTARIWDAQTGELLFQPLRHGERVRTAEFSPDGNFVVTAAYSRDARIWDIRDGGAQPAIIEQTAWLAEHPNIPPDLADGQFSGGGRKALLLKANDVVVHDSSGKVLYRLPHQEFTQVARFSPDGRWLVTAGDDRLARIWDAATGTKLGEPFLHRGNVLDAAFSPNNALLATASADDTAALWDLAAGKRRATLQHRRSVVRVVFSADAARVATASWDGTAAVWDTRSGEIVGRPLAHGDRVLDVAFSPDGQRVATASWDRTARVWETATGLPVTIPLPHAARLTGVRFTADGTGVMTLGEDGKASTWHVPRASGAQDLSTLAEAAVCQRITAKGVTELLTWEELEQIRSRCQQLSPGTPAARIARWFFSDRATRPAAP